MLEMQNTEAAVIGRFIIDGDSHCAFDIDFEVFTNESLRGIYSEFADNDSVSISVLVDKYGEDYVSSIVSVACPSSTIRSDVLELKKAHYRRVAIKSLNDAIEGVRSGVEIGKVIADVVNDTATCDDSERVVSICEAMHSYHERLQIVANGGEVPSMYIPSGYSSFDDKIGGFASSDLTIIGGRPSLGKTAFALGSALHQAREGKRILWFSMDSSIDSIVARAFANVANADLRDLMKYKPSYKDMGSVAGSVEVIGDCDILIDKSPNLTVERLQAIARKYNAIKPLDMIYVDYIQQISGTGTEYETVTKASGALKRLANELMCGVVGLVQLNRGIESRANKIPTMADIRSSGQIEQDAYLILFPYRPERDAQSDEEAAKLKGIAELYIVKNKDGPIGVVTEGNIHFDENSAAYRNTSNGGFDEF